MRYTTTFGELFRKLRIERRMTLRRFCADFGFDPGNISKLERGRLAPPQAEKKLTEYARALGLKNGSTLWYEFFDLAAAESGMLPGDIMSDKELVAELPLVFRTLRRRKVSDKKLKGLGARERRA